MPALRIRVPLEPEEQALQRGLSVDPSSVPGARPGTGALWCWHDPQAMESSQALLPSLCANPPTLLSFIGLLRQQSALIFPCIGEGVQMLPECFYFQTVAWGRTGWPLPSAGVGPESFARGQHGVKVNKQKFGIFRICLSHHLLYSLVSRQGSLLWFSVVCVCREGNTGQILALGWLRSPAEPRLRGL